MKHSGEIQRSSVSPNNVSVTASIQRINQPGIGSVIGWTSSFSFSEAIAAAVCGVRPCVQVQSASMKSGFCARTVTVS